MLKLCYIDDTLEACTKRKTQDSNSSSHNYTIGSCSPDRKILSKCILSLWDSLSLYSGTHGPTVLSEQTVETEIELEEVQNDTLKGMHTKSGFAVRSVLMLWQK